MKEFVDKFLKNFNFPIIICDIEGRHEIKYANVPALLTFNPQYSTAALVDEDKTWFLSDFLSYDETEYDTVKNILKNAGSVDEYVLRINGRAKNSFEVKVSSGIFEYAGKDYVLLYFSIKESRINKSYSDKFISLLNSLHHHPRADEAIRAVLNAAGSFVGVSRAYIFEEIDDMHVGNTYEWCADGIDPAISGLSKLSKSDYNHNAIMSSMYVSDDVGALPVEDRLILEPQGIKSLAILPLFDYDRPLGYIGFDHCEKMHSWGKDELSFLKNIANICTTLIIKRNSETEVRRSREILQTISDSLDAIVYVSDPVTYDLKFVNKALMDSLKIDGFEGKKCWQLLQKDMTGPCPFCPIPKLMDEKGEFSKTYEWEHQNTITGNWYWVKDAAIKWVDGKTMHMETAVDVTMRKKFEEQLQFYASIDVMTNTFNREWGYNVFSNAWKEVSASGAKYSVCFIDIDGLKDVNDRFGHNTGDEMIIKTLERIRKRVRRDDVICRWGGDEFILLLSCPREKATEIIHSIQKDIDEHNAKDGLKYTLSFSFGIAEMSADHSLDETIRLADELMYVNKITKRIK